MIYFKCAVGFIASFAYCLVFIIYSAPISIKILFWNPYCSTNIYTHFKFVLILLIPNKMILDRAKNLVNAEDSTRQLKLESLWQ